MGSDPLRPQAKDMKFKLPFLTHPEHGEVIACGFLEYGLGWAGGFHNHQPRVPACGFRKLLNKYALGLLF